MPRPAEQELGATFPLARYFRPDLFAFGLCAEDLEALALAGPAGGVSGRGTPEAPARGAVAL